LGTYHTGKHGISLDSKVQQILKILAPAGVVPKLQVSNLFNNELFNRKIDPFLLPVKNQPTFDLVGCFPEPILDRKYFG
jgi:hypothetical protein